MKKSIAFGVFLLMATSTGALAGRDHGCKDERYLTTCDGRRYVPTRRGGPDRFELPVRGHHRHARGWRARRAVAWHGPRYERVYTSQEPRFRRVEGGYAMACAGSHCGRVIAWAADKFTSLFRDLVSRGYNIGSPGCLSSGHMWHSKHHWGGACDLFNQVARNRTALRQPSPRVQIEAAERYGLVSGCIWRNPDCGHFEVPSRAYASR